MAYLLTGSILGLGFELLFLCISQNQDTPCGYRLQMGNIAEATNGDLLIIRWIQALTK